MQRSAELVLCECFCVAYTAYHMACLQVPCLATEAQSLPRWCVGECAARWRIKVVLYTLNEWPWRITSKGKFDCMLRFTLVR